MRGSIKWLLFIFLTITTMFIWRSLNVFAFVPFMNIMENSTGLPIDTTVNTWFNAVWGITFALAIIAFALKLSQEEGYGGSY